LLELRVKFKFINELNFLGLSQELLGHISEVVVDLSLDVAQRSFDTGPEIDFLEGRALLDFMVKLGDSSNVSEPLGHELLQSSDKSRILHIGVKVLGRDWEGPSCLLLIVFGLDFWVMDEFDIGHDDVLLALLQVGVKRIEILLDVLKGGRGGS